MEILIDLLKSAKGEIIAGILFALLGWVYSRFRRITRLYKRQKQELERMTNEMNQRGITKQECERLREALKQAEAQHQEDLQRITKLQNQIETQQQEDEAELIRKEDTLKQAEAQHQEDLQRITKLQNQLEIQRRDDEKLKAELQRKEEVLRQLEAQQAERQKELEREKSKKRIPPMSDHDFIELCKSGDAEKVEEAIMNGANVNAKDNDGCTALIDAVINGQIEAAKVLLKHGAVVNAKDKWGRTALSEAKMWNRTEIAQILREYGGRLPPMSDHDFIELCKSGNVREVEEAIKDGANVNAKDNYGRTAFSWAVLNFNMVVAKLLREYGAK